MMTRIGLARALRSIIGAGLELGLYVNELGAESSLADVQWSDATTKIFIPTDQWTFDGNEVRGTQRHVFQFARPAGKILGYTLDDRVELLAVQPFKDAIPIQSIEDVVKVLPRFRARELVQ